MSLARADGDGVRVVVRVKPRSSVEGVDVVTVDGNDTVVVRVNAPPVEGKANDRVREVMAKALGVSRSRVRIIRGEGAREKDLAVSGVDVEGVEALLRR